MLERFLTYCKTLGIDKGKHKVLLTVSGGIDSMVMLRLFHESGFECGIAHCNFRLRGIESDEDELFVTNRVLSLGHSFHVTHFNTRKYAEENGISIEMAARELRYQWFETIRKTFGYHFIATAHHKDDNAETVLLNQIRGTGIKGLTGISPIHQNIIRPMLFATRSEIEEYSALKKIEFRTDSSNNEIIYKRNLVRNRIIPLLKSMNASIIDTFDQNTSNIRESYMFYKTKIDETISNIINHVNGKQYMSIPRLEQTGFIHLILHEWLSQFGFTETGINNIIENLQTQSGKRFYSQTHCVVKDRTELILFEHKIENINIEIPDTSTPFPANSVFSLEIIENPDINFKTISPFTGFFDKDKLHFPLRIRQWQHGDSFIPLGMKQSKKISDVLIDAKIPLSDKNDICILEDSTGTILWIIGVRMGEFAKLSNASKNIIRISKNV